MSSLGATRAMRNRTKILKSRRKGLNSSDVGSAFRDRVLLALRRLGIGGGRGAGLNELDRLMGKAEGTTSGMLTRTSSPRLDTAILLARHLHVRLEWLATGD